MSELHFSFSNPEENKKYKFSIAFAPDENQTNKRNSCNPPPIPTTTTSETATFIQPPTESTSAFTTVVPTVTTMTTTIVPPSSIPIAPPPPPVSVLHRVNSMTSSLTKESRELVQSADFCMAKSAPLIQIPRNGTPPPMYMTNLIGKEELREVEMIPMSTTSNSSVSSGDVSTPDIEWEADDYTLEDYDDETQWDHLLPETIAKPTEVTKIKVQNILLLYNPKSGAKKGKRFARKAQEIFLTNKVNVDMIKLKRAGHGEELCQTMDISRYDVVCILGGDGTFHECINGYMRRQDDAKTKIPLAMIPGGTGNSFALELQGGTKISRACKHILRGLNCPIDISEIYFPTENRISYSFNSLHWGLASKVNVTAERLRWMGKAVRYTTAALLELMRGEKTLALVEIWDKDDKKIEYKDYFCLLIANNIMSAAKGMKMAPDARLNDGLIDLLLIRSSKTLDLMKIFQKVYEGTHVDLEFVEYIQAKSFSVIPFRKGDPSVIETEPDAEVAEELLDIDGELIGITPFKCTVIPRCLRVII